jgi:hypothetical protein
MVQMTHCAKYFHLSVPHLEDVAQVIDVSQNEIQIRKLAGSPEELDAAAGQARDRRGVAVPLHDAGGLRIPRLIAPRHKFRGDPSAANLVFDAELALTAGADYGDAGMVLRHIGGDRGVTAEAS